ncbi:MAG: hypothetical protein ACXVB9_03325 [Bdellovibrionota bacterium]
MKTFFTLVALLGFLPFAEARDADKAKPEPFVDTVSLAGVPGASGRYLLQACDGQNCRVVGSSAGYTAEQIMSLAGHSRELLAVIEGTAETAVISYVGASATVMAATAGSAHTMATYGALNGLLAGAGSTGSLITTVKVVRALNPVHQFRQGEAAVELKSGLAALKNSGKESVSLYSGSSQKAALAEEKRLGEELSSLGESESSREPSSSASAQ